MGGIGGGAGGGGGIGGDAGGGQQQGQDDPPVIAARSAVSEELVWKARAVRAEARASELEERISEIESQMEQMQDENAKAERRREMELELSIAEALDIETAVILVERALESDGALDVPGAVAELKRTKPFLFRASPRASVMSGYAGGGGRDVLADLADDAKSSGDRSALLRYLRARRGA